MTITSFVEQNSIVLSCGHSVSTFEEGHDAAIAGYDRRGQKAVFYSVLCSSCLELERSYDNLLCSDEDILMWLED